MAIDPKYKELLQKNSELELQLKTIKKRKKYGLVWEDKPEEIVEACKSNVPILSLKKKKKGIDPVITTDASKGDNILIEGDNYHALSVLNYTHKGKISVIYIDPPYNTGAKDWKYNNDYVDINDSYRHSKWVSLMANRLLLARNLLTEKGVLIVTIDDNELFHLGTLLEEIFYAYEAFIITIEHNRRGRRGKNFAKTNEWAIFLIPKGDEAVQEEKSEVMIGGETRNLRRTGSGSKRIERPRKFYPIWVNSKTLEVVKAGDPLAPDAVWEVEEKGDLITVWPVDEDGREKNWHYGVERTRACIKKGELQVRPQSYGLQVYYTLRIKDSKKFKTVWTGAKYDASTYGTVLLNTILGTEKAFDYPKSIHAVIDSLNAVVGENPEAIILDFFAGSGTTGHAVLELNKRDDGNRKFILCTNNENNICEEVTYRRLRGVMDGYKYKGKDRTPLYLKELSLSDIVEDHEETAMEIREVIEENKSKFDKIQTDFKNNLITIEGLKNATGSVEGLGGNLRYYTTDLVNIENLHKVSDDGRIKLTHQAGEMIGLRENTLNEVQRNEWWQIFEGHGKTTAIYFKEDKARLLELVEILELKNAPAVLYIFSWGKNEYKAEYSSVNLKIEDIPEPILEVYKEINRI